MGQTVDQIKTQSLTSIYGARLGLSGPTGGVAVRADFIAGPKDIIRAVQDLTSASTGTALNPYGVVNIAGTSLLTSAQTFLLSNPIPGIPVTINNARSNATAGASGSTVITIDRPSTAFYIESSEMSSGVAITLNESASITLMGVSTSKYVVTARSGVGAAVVGAT